MDGRSRNGRERRASRSDGAALVAVAGALPETRRGSAEIAEQLAVDEHWILQRTGIRERRVLRDDECLVDLASTAARRVLAKAEVEPEEVDLLLVATATAEQLMPNAAPLLAGELGLSRAGCADIGSACTGFVTALSLAVGQLESGLAKTAVVVGVDALSRFLDPTDRATAPVFGDGAGAVVLRAVDPPGRVVSSILRSDGAGRDLVRIPATDNRIRMDGHETFKHAVNRLEEVTRECVALAKRRLDDVSLFVYHQANARILRAVGERLGVEGDRIVNCVEELGNTSAASVPLALEWAERTDRLHQGTTILLGAFGAGLTWGAMLLDWGAPA